MSQSIPPPSDVPQSRLFEGWGQTMLILRWPVLLACAAITAFMAHHASEGLVVDTRTEAFVPRDSDAATALDDLRREFSAGRSAQVLVKGDVFSVPFIARLANLHSSLDALEGPTSPLERLDPFRQPEGDDEGWGHSPVRSVTSLVSLGHLRRVEDGVAYGPWGEPPTTPEAVRAFRDEVMADPDLRGRVVDETGSFAIVGVELDDVSSGELREALARIEEVLHSYAEAGFEPALGGPLAVQVAVYEGVLADQEFLISAEAVAMLLMMWLVFRHPMGVLGPLLVVAQAATCMFGWMSLVGTPLSMISAVLGALVVCTGVAFSVHLQAAYRRCRAEGQVNERAVVTAVASNGAPLLFTPLVTCAAMLSFAAADMEPIREWGLAAAAGIFFCGLFTLTFLPAWLALNTRSRLGLRHGPVRRPGVWARVLAWFNRLSRRSSLRRRAILALGLVSAGAFVYFAARVELRHDPAAWLPPNLPALEATRELGKHAGGSTRLHLLVAPEGDRDGLDPAVLSGLARLARGAETFDGASADDGGPLVRGSHSVLDLFVDANRALGIAAADAAPRARGHAVDLTTMWEQLAPEALRRYLSLDRKRALLSLEVGWSDVRGYEALTRHLDRLVERDLGGVARVRLAGHAYNSFTVARALLGDLTRGFLVALSVVGVLLLLLQRDLRLVLVALVPTLWPLLGVLGFMGATGRSLDIQSVLVAAIAMGFGVDNAIHFLHLFRVHFAGYGDVNEAVTFAFQHKGPDMLGTSTVLASGFAVMMLGYMGSTRTFGLLAVVVVALGLVANLLFMPALLRSLFRTRPRAYDPQRASSYDLSLSEFS